VIVYHVMMESAVRSGAIRGVRGPRTVSLVRDVEAVDHTGCKEFE